MSKVGVRKIFIMRLTKILVSALAGAIGISVAKGIFQILPWEVLYITPYNTKFIITFGIAGFLIGATNGVFHRSFLKMVNKGIFSAVGGVIGGIIVFLIFSKETIWSFYWVLCLPFYLIYPIIGAFIGLGNGITEGKYNLLLNPILGAVGGFVGIFVAIIVHEILPPHFSSQWDTFFIMSISGTIGGFIGITNHIPERENQGPKKKRHLESQEKSCV